MSSAAPAPSPAERRAGRRWDAAVLALAALVIAGTGLWMDRFGWFVRPPTIDAADTRYDAEKMLVAWRDGGFGSFLAQAHAPARASHPPLLPMTAAVIARIAGAEVEPLHCWLAVQPFALLFLWGAYRLARRALSPAQAFFAVFLTATAPVVIVNLRPFFQQLPMAALVLWAWDALQRSDRFARLGPSLAFGLFAGLAGFTKTIAPVYLAGGLVAAIVGALRRGAVARPIVHALAAAAVAHAIIGPWWFLNHDRVTGYAEGVVGEDGQRLWSEGRPLSDPGRWAYYPVQFANCGIGVTLAAAVLVAAAWIAFGRGAAAVGARRKLAGVSIALWSALGAWILLTIGQVAGRAYYVQGLAPPVLVVLVAATSALGSKARRIACVALAAAALLNVGFALRDPIEDDVVLKMGPFELGARTDAMFGMLARGAEIDPRRDRDAWPNRAFVDEILRRSPRARPVIGETAINFFCGHLQFPFEAARFRREVDVWCPTEAQLVGGAWTDVGPRLLDSDFLLVHGRALSFLPTLPQCEEFVARLGLESEIAGDVHVTPGWRVTLLKLSRPRRLGGVVAPPVARARPGFRAAGADTVGGRRIEGLATERAPDGAELWTVFLRARGAEETAALELSLRAPGIRRASRSVVFAAPPAQLTDENDWCATTFEFESAYAEEAVTSAELAIIPVAAGAASGGRAVVKLSTPRDGVSRPAARPASRRAAPK
jgi:hypothetical protein